MSTLFAAIWLVTLIWFIVLWRKKKAARLNGGTNYETDEIYLAVSKKKRIIGVVCIISFFLCGATAPKKESPVTSEKPVSITAVPDNAEVVPQTKEASRQEEPQPQVPMEHRQALKAAELYLKTMPFSKRGLYHQLTSEYGNKFPPEAAQYAVDNVKTDWNENAARAAANYLNLMPMSREELIQQLTSEAGDKYTLEEAQYGVEKVYK